MIADCLVKHSKPQYTIVSLCALILVRYMYETGVGLNMPSYEDYKYGVEYLFISLLAKSKFRTKVHSMSESSDPGPYHYHPRSIPLLSQVHTTTVPDPYHYCPRSIPLHTTLFYYTILTERYMYVIMKHVMIVVQISSHHFRILL